MKEVPVTLHHHNRTELTPFMYKIELTGNRVRRQGLLGCVESVKVLFF